MIKLRTTVKDVAKAAGVSASIVSRVMNGAEKSTSRVSAATTERVREAAKRLGYNRLSPASVLRTRRTCTFAVLGGFHPQTGWFYPSGNMEILSGINRALAEDSRYSLLLDLERRRRTDGSKALYEGRVDGAFVVEHLDERLLEDLKDTNTPYVRINVEPGCDSVYPDDIAPLRSVLELWKASGVRRIAFLQEGWMSEHYSTTERRRMTLEICGELGMEAAVNLFPLEQEVSSLAREIEAQRFGGVVCYGENSAQTLGQHWLLDPSARFRPRMLCWTRPTRENLMLPWIERIVIPFETMGQRAAETLIARLNGTEDASSPVRIPCRHIPAISSSECLRWLPSHHELMEKEML